MTNNASETPGPLTKLTEEELLFRTSVRSFADKCIRPLVREMDTSKTIPRALIDDLFKLGIMGIEAPDEFQGSGGYFFQTILAIEAISRVDPSIALLVDVHNTLVINALLQWGNQDLKRRYLPRLTSSSVGAYALSESSSGSDAFSLTTRCIHRDGAFELTGRKLWITNAAEADIFVVFANAKPESGHRGITAFIVERDMEGFSIGVKEDKLGIRASSTCELILDACLVPNSNLLGEIGQGYKVAMETLNAGRIGIGAQMIGLASGALGHAVAYTKERKQFGKPIADFQGVQFQLAQAATELEAARLTVYNAARLRDGGHKFLTESAMCKLFSSDVAEKVTSLAVQLFGGYGYVKDYPVEKLYRDAKIGQIYEGTSNLQLQTIAKQILENRF